MLAIAVPRFPRRKGRRPEKHFREEALIFVDHVHADEVCLEPTDAHGGRASDEDVGGAGRRGRALQEGQQQVRRVVDPVDRQLEVDDVVASAVLGLPGPSEPVERRAEEQAHGRMRLEDLDLTRELPGQPDVVGIEQGEVLAPGIVESEVPGGAHAVVPMPRVLQVANAVRLALGPPAGERGASVGGPVVDQQQLPVGVGLRNHAPDGLIQEALSVQKDRDDRYQRSSAHESPRSGDLGCALQVLRREVGLAGSGSQGAGNIPLDGSCRARQTPGPQSKALRVCCCT